MGKIRPFEILGETFANAFRWIHFFLPIALVVAFIGTALNGYLSEMLLAAEPAAVPDNFWTAWAFVMIGIFATQAVQLSLFDAVMERRPGWFSFGLARALRRLLPTLLGVLLFFLAYLVGLVLLVIPGLMVLFLLYMMMPLILLDGVGPFAAVKASWDLTWGNTWRLVGAIFLTFLPVLLAFWVIAFAFGILSVDPAGMMQPSSWSDWRTWVWALLTGVIGVFIGSFYLVAFKALKIANSGNGEAEPEPVTV